MIRFHLDQHVATAVARGLRRHGIDVTTTTDAGLQDADDPDHLAFALREGRALFTMDQGFVRRHHIGEEHAGIVYTRQQTKSIGDIIRFLELMNDCLEPEDMYRQIEYF